MWRHGDVFRHRGKILSCSVNVRGLDSLHKVKYMMSVETAAEFIYCVYVTKVFRFWQKVKQCHYKPGQALRVLGVWGSHISRQSAHEGVKLVSPMPRPPLPAVNILVLISFRGWVDPRAIVRPEGLCQRKIPMIPSGIEPATFRLVVQYLNQLRYRVPLYSNKLSQIL